MLKNHVVKRRGYFEVVVAPTFPWEKFGTYDIRHFKSWKYAFRFYRYHVNQLNWDFGVIRFVDNNDIFIHVLVSFIREA